MDPTINELSDLSTACNKLWELDFNRLIPKKDYEIDCGEGKKVYEHGDMAESSLFTWITEDVLKKPTFSRFCSLLDNYNPHQGCKEVVTSEDKQEQVSFIEEISRTAPIIYLHSYLSRKGVVHESFQEFKKMMSSLWFDIYGRHGVSGCSSAFEHVFVGEIKDRGPQEVSGFHNWIQVCAYYCGLMLNLVLHFVQNCQFSPPEINLANLVLQLVNISRFSPFR